MTEGKGFQENCARFGTWSVIGTCFCLPWSTSLMDLFSALVVIFWCLSGRFLSLPRLARYNPVILLAIALFLFFLVGLIYSPAPLQESFAALMKYRELLLLPMAVSLIMNDNLAVRRSENSFLAGAVLLMLVSYAMAFSLVPAAKYGNSLVFHITHSFFMAILSFWSLQRALDSSRYRYFWLLIFAAATLNIAFIAPGRTGLLSYFILMLLTVMQRLPWKGRMAGCLLFCLLIPAGFFASSNISSRVQQAMQDIIHYEPGAARTSLGMRLDWWTNSLELIAEKPLIGHGTGSFAVKQQELVKGAKTKRSDNPHNEYLFIGVQLGLTGMAMFITLLVSEWLYAGHLPAQRKFLLQGIVLTMATGCLMNSFLFDSHQGHFFAFLSALFLASPRPLAPFRT